MVRAKVLENSRTITDFDGQDLEFSCLSTDEKPIDEYYGIKILGGTYLLEIDTSKVFAYDEESKTWKEL